jgi:ATP-dependent Clp protease ATP-binding subunit ClpB
LEEDDENIEKVNDTTKARILDRVKAHFSPEFINRVDELVVFNRLSPSSLRQIVDIRLKEICDRVSDQNIVLDIEDPVKDWLAKHGYDIAYGARPLNRLIQKKIMNPLSKILISNDKIGQIKVKLSNNEIKLE